MNDYLALERTKGSKIARVRRRMPLVITSWAFILSANEPREYNVVGMKFNLCVFITKNATIDGRFTAVFVSVNLFRFARTLVNYTYACACIYFDRHAR